MEDVSGKMEDVKEGRRTSFDTFTSKHIYLTC